MAEPVSATATKQFQLFPPPPPRTSSVNAMQSRKPGQRPQRQQSRSPAAGIPTIELLKSEPNRESVVVQIMERSRSVSPPAIPQRTATPERTRQITQADYEYPPPPPAPKSPVRIVPTGQRDVPIIKAPKPPALAHLRSKSIASQQAPMADSPQSPVPIRSMFPRYDPSVPLNKQPYYPQRATTPNDPPRQIVSRDSYNTQRIVTPSGLDRIVGGPKTAPASVVNFPAGIMMPEEPEVSSAEDLLRLWDATNGQSQGRERVLGGFTLQVARYVNSRYTSQNID